MTVGACPCESGYVRDSGEMLQGSASYQTFIFSEERIAMTVEGMSMTVGVCP